MLSLSYIEEDTNRRRADQSPPPPTHPLTSSFVNLPPSILRCLPSPNRQILAQALNCIVVWETPCNPRISTSYNVSWRLFAEWLRVQRRPTHRIRFQWEVFQCGMFNDKACISEKRSTSISLEYIRILSEMTCQWTSCSDPTPCPGANQPSYTRRTYVGIIARFLPGGLKTRRPCSDRTRILSWLLLRGIVAMDSRSIPAITILPLGEKKGMPQVWSPISGWTDDFQCMFAVPTRGMAGD